MTYREAYRIYKKAQQQQPITADAFSDNASNWFGKDRAFTKDIDWNKLQTFKLPDTLKDIKMPQKKQGDIVVQTPEGSPSQTNTNIV